MKVLCHFIVMIKKNICEKKQIRKNMVKYMYIFFKFYLLYIYKGFPNKGDMF